MSGMDERHLEMELAKFVEDVRVVEITTDGFYAVLPALDSTREGIIRSYARLQYLGKTYADARAYMVHRWGPQHA